MDYACGKFGDCNFSRFGFIVQTNRQTDRHTQMNERSTTQKKYNLKILSKSLLDLTTPINISL